MALSGMPSVAWEPDLAMVTGTLSLARQAESVALTGMPPVTLCLELQLASPRQLRQSDQLLLHLRLPYSQQLCLCLRCSCMHSLKPEALRTHLPHLLPTLVTALIILLGTLCYAHEARHECATASPACEIRSSPSHVPNRLSGPPSPQEDRNTAFESDCICWMHARPGGRD